MPKKNKLSILISCLLSYFFSLHAAKSHGKLRFINSRWGGKLLVLNGYQFSSNKRDSKGVTYYRCTFCSSRKKNPCHARCIVRNGELVKISAAEHNHPPGKLEKYEAKNVFQK